MRLIIPTVCAIKNIEYADRGALIVVYFALRSQLFSRKEWRLFRNRAI